MKLERFTGMDFVIFYAYSKLHYWVRLSLLGLLRTKNTEGCLKVFRSPNLNLTPTPLQKRGNWNVCLVLITGNFYTLFIWRMKRIFW